MDLLEFEASLFYSVSFRAAWATQRNPGGRENRKNGTGNAASPPHTQRPNYHAFATPSARLRRVTQPASLSLELAVPPIPASAHAPWARRQVSPGQRARARPSAEPEKRQAASGARSRSSLSSPGLFY